MMNLKGLHHITAVTAEINNNAKFYTNVLGLRLVKKSVNQDDISAYHLFYADKQGSPGTDMTFFDWPRIGPNVRGTDSIAGTAFRVTSSQALEFWLERFNQFGLVHGEITTFAGRQLLPFEDHEGQQLYLVNDNDAPFEGEIWQRPDIPDDYAIKGFYAVVLSVPEIKRLIIPFTKIMNFSEQTQSLWLDGKSQAVIFSTTPDGGPGTELWLLEQPHLSRARLGAGGTHHVAFRVKDIEDQKEWHTNLTNAGFQVSALIDRFWFNSIYFRISNGILFEIATDGPGFAIDENPDSLGEKLVLPPFLENRRQAIEANLTPIEV
jgi:glyoxalase family protein